MNKKLEEKILAEIRNRVIEKDRELKNQQELNLMREANIEALTELTSLSRKEVEKIGNQVKAEFITKENKKRKKIITSAVLGATILLIMFFIFRPVPPPKESLTEDNFSENNYDWVILKGFENKRDFIDQQYIIETNKENWCFWDGIKMKLPKNYTIEIHSKWMGGKFGSYGLGLHKDDKNYHSFNLRGDGAASYGKLVDGEWLVNDPWKADFAHEGKLQTNIQRIEVKDNGFNYYVNDKLLKTGPSDFSANEFALRCCGEQKVAFLSVKITNTDTKELVFEDNFINPSEQWKPTKKYDSESYFENGKYILNTNNENSCYFSTSETHQISGNCTIELISTWISGDLSSYGFMLLNDNENYYSFELQNNGEARMVQCLNNEYVYVQNHVNTGLESDGKLSIRQKLVLENGEASYFVNDKLIKKSALRLSFPCKIALRCCGKQSVAFDNLVIKNYE